uniref:Uncharacterized protein n=2 Tax=Phaeomonas parva TaxID=124430 RepID=A0A7S1TZP7_9STRA|mmetsp:Transcript_25145/g.78913  ORF Transcript_25145/g.78913 Transcript_25145/m.78913 type:complete len:266 (+) Transcript_25145:72-869(+)
MIRRGVVLAAWAVALLGGQAAALAQPSRRVALQRAVAAGLGVWGLQRPGNAADAPDEGMRFAPGAGNMPGKTLPEVGGLQRDRFSSSGGDTASDRDMMSRDFGSQPTGAVQPVVPPKKGKGGYLREQLTTASGQRVEVTFASPYPAIPTSAGVETRDMNSGDSAFVAAASLVGAQRLSDAPRSFFTDAILGIQGKFGAYGAPQDVKFNGDAAKGPNGREVEISFTALTPAMREVPRRILVTAIQVSPTPTLTRSRSRSRSCRSRS